MPDQCPACGSRDITTRPERVQSNGLTTGSGRCQRCRFTWTTINGALSRNSAKSVEAHQRSMTGRASGWRL